jgi:trigger factor
MNITKENVDALNAVVKVQVEQKDYQDKVTKILEDYRKTANIPGFRQGKVPMGMVKKQYGKAILVDEVNKLIQEGLNKFLVEEKLDILGNPLPRIQADFDWDNENYEFEFELGLAPEIKIDLQPKKALTKYKIVADNKMVDAQVTSIQEQYGKRIAIEKVEDADTQVTGTFTNEEKEINKQNTFKVSKFKSKAAQKALIGKKVGDVVTLKTKGLFEDDHQLMHITGVSHDDAHGLDINIDFKIEEIVKIEPAELNQELFDKLFGEGNVKTVAELKAKIKEDAEGQFVQQADQKFIDDVSNYLMDSTKFDLPAEFLTKWLKTAGEKELNDDEAVAEYAKSEQGLRWQLIEGQLMKDNNIKIEFDELKAYTKELLGMQFAQYGQPTPAEEEMDNVVARVFQNKEEVQRLTDQLMNQKMLAFFKENIKSAEKEISFDDFIELSYGHKH